MAFYTVYFLAILFTSIKSQLITNWESSEIGSLTEPISSGCIISIESTIYIFGGITNDNELSDRILKWDINNSKFNQISATLPIPIYCDTQSITYNTNNELIYIIGATSSPSTYGNILIFNPSTDTFEDLGNPSMFIPVRSNCIIMDNANNLLYSIGGLDANETAINLLQILDIDKNKWIKQQYINEIPINIVSSSCWMSESGSDLYSFGGKSSFEATSGILDILRYKIAANSWSFVGNLTKPKSGTNAIYINEYNLVSIIGGKTIDGYTGEIEIFDPENPTHTISDESVITNDANQYYGRIMSVYIITKSKLYVWGVYKSNTSIMLQPLYSNSIISSPTSPTLSITPSKVTTINPKDNNSNLDDAEGGIDENENEVPVRITLESIILIGIISLIIVCIGIIAMLYIRIAANTKRILEENEIKIEKIPKKKHRLPTESIPAVKIIEEQDSNTFDVNPSNKQKADAICSDVECIQSPKSEMHENIIDVDNHHASSVVIEREYVSTIDDVIGHLQVNNRNNMDEDIEDTEVISVNSFNTDTANSAMARRGSIGGMTVMTQQTSVLANIYESDNDVDSRGMPDIEQENNDNGIFAPYKHTNDMANHEMAEGFYNDIHVGIDDDDENDGGIGDDEMKVIHDDNLEIDDNIGVMSIVSISEVQFEGLSKKRDKKKKRKERKKKKKKRKKSKHNKVKDKQTDNGNEY